MVYFIDRQLAGPYRRFQEKYRAGLQSLQKTSQQMFGKPFEELAWDDQTKLLEIAGGGQGAQGIVDGSVGRRVLQPRARSHHARLLRQSAARRQSELLQLQDDGTGIPADHGPESVSEAKSLNGAARSGTPESNKWLFDTSMR